MALLAALLLWSGANLYLWHRAREVRALEARLHALSQEARRLSLALEAERAKNGALSQEAERTKRELEALKKAIEELRRRAGLSPINATPVRYREGAKGGGAMAAWTEVEATLLDLKNQLAEVTPALERTLEIEESLPLGLPLRGHRGVTSFFGVRKNPFGPGWEFHDGLDFSALYGAPVYATGSGVVARVGWMGPTAWRCFWTTPRATRPFTATSPAPPCAPARGWSGARSWATWAPRAAPPVPTSTTPSTGRGWRWTPAPTWPPDRMGRMLRRKQAEALTYLAPTPRSWETSRPGARCA